MALSSTLIAATNFAAMLLSIPVIAAGIWLSTQTDNSCLNLIQWPVIALGIVILVVALAGFIGAFWRIPWLLMFYLVAMLILIVLLASLILFVFAVTSGGSGHPVPSRVYREYKLEDYSVWMRRRVESSYKWNRIKACLGASSTCAQLNQTYQSAMDFFSARISPLEVSANAFRQILSSNLVLVCCYIIITILRRKKMSRKMLHTCFFFFFLFFYFKHKQWIISPCSINQIIYI